MINETIAILKDMGFVWDRATIGIKFDEGRWNVNAVLINDDGSRKPAYGFLRYDNVEDAVDARIALEAA